jgi:hypothetical protein
MRLLWVSVPDVDIAIRRQCGKGGSLSEGGVLTQMLPKASGVEANRRAVH